MHETCAVMSVTYNSKQQTASRLPKYSTLLSRIPSVHVHYMYTLVFNSQLAVLIRSQRSVNVSRLVISFLGLMHSMTVPLISMTMPLTTCGWETLNSAQNVRQNASCGR
ncbi:hypothetical protein BC832DRAFT_399350 [Gaertneriomyces semiglobifer]|nr:hypothetical protein BC832DRAFT_399350 [Gaertneriomyces semiglobifer]